jgi:hypothetical protein
MSVLRDSNVPPSMQRIFCGRCRWKVPEHLVERRLAAHNARTSCRLHRSGCDATRRTVSRTELPRQVFKLQGHRPPLVVRAKSSGAAIHGRGGFSERLVHRSCQKRANRNVWPTASPQAKCEVVTGWSAQVYTTFMGVNHSWPGMEDAKASTH